MNDCDRLLGEIIAQARELGIPVSGEIDPHVRINGHALTRFGCCRLERGRPVIEVARRVAEGPEWSCRETLAHEVLHTCWGCRNHGKRWKEYARRMNRAYHYRITRTSTNEELGVAEERPCRYLLRCECCGAEFRRYRASPLVKDPGRYRCRCGGRLIRVPEGEKPIGPQGIQM